jgi:hypothetical protein
MTQHRPRHLKGALALTLFLTLWALQGSPPDAPPAQRAHSPAQAAPTAAIPPSPDASPAPRAVVADSPPRMGAQADARGRVRVVTVEVGGQPLPVAADHVTARVTGPAEALAPWLKAQGSALLGQSPWTGRVRLAVPEGAAPDAFARALAQHPALADVRPDPVVEATGAKPKKEKKVKGLESISLPDVSYLAYQWHLPAGGATAMWQQHYDGALLPCASLYAWQGDCGRCKGMSVTWAQAQMGACLSARYQRPAPAPVRVAVLDTGITYRSAQSAAAPALERAVVIPGHDFINEDGEALDDNQHGTHMATTMASQGKISGTAWGGELLPVKVLDRDKVGTESALIEGLYFAVERGAGVVNMSLSFPRAYLPSEEMERAILHAHQRGVVMVASAGNDGEDFVSYPAAFPDVIAVGASSLNPDSGALELAPYSNHSAALDLLAPGGRLDLDVNRDGLPDGILAQTFLLHEPGVQGYWLMAGTSPAAAQVSGVVAALLQAGESPAKARWLLTAYADSPPGHDLRRHGAGMLNAEAALAAAGQDEGPAQEYAVNATVLLASGEGDARHGVAIVEVIDGDNQPVAGVTVHGAWVGDAAGDMACTTDAQGLCRATSPAAPWGQLFGVQVLAVEDALHHPHRPVAVHRFDELTYRLLATLSPADARNVAFSYSPEALAGFPVEGGALPTVTLKNIGAGLASSALVLGVDYDAFLRSPLSVSYLHLTSFGTGLASSSIVIDANFFNQTYLQSYSPSTMLVRSYSYGSGLASSSALFFGGASWGFQSLELAYNPGVLYLNSGTGLASSSLVRDISYWNTSLFTLTPSLNTNLMGYGTGLASSSFVLDLNLQTASWLGWSPQLYSLYGTGLASSSLVLIPTNSVQYSSLQTSSWSALTQSGVQFQF